MLILGLPLFPAALFLLWALLIGLLAAVSVADPTGAGKPGSKKELRPQKPTLGAPVFYGKQPMQNFKGMFPPYGMGYQPLHKLPADHPANQMGKREHMQWSGTYPQAWGDPLPHNSPGESSCRSSPVLHR